MAEVHGVCPTGQGGPSPRRLLLRPHLALRLLWGPRARKVRGQAHSLEQAHARCGSQVEGCVYVSLLGHVPKCLVQAFNKTLAGPGRVVCIAGDAPT